MLHNHADTALGPRLASQLLIANWHLMFSFGRLQTGVNACVLWLGHWACTIESKIGHTFGLCLRERKASTNKISSKSNFFFGQYGIYAPPLFSKAHTCPACHGHFNQPSSSSFCISLDTTPTSRLNLNRTVRCPSPLLLAAENSTCAQTLTLTELEDFSITWSLKVKGKLSLRDEPSPNPILLPGSF